MAKTLKSTLKSRVNISIINNTDNNSVLSERINEQVVDEFVEDTLTNRRYLFDDIMQRLYDNTLDRQVEAIAEM